MQLIRTLASLNDVVEIANFIAVDNRDAAARFVTAVDVTYELIKTAPNSGSPERLAKTQLRKWFVKGFKKYCIFYVVGKDEIKILRIIHTARDYRRILK